MPEPPIAADTRLPGAGRWSLTAATLISANLFPLAGVLFWNWSVFQIVVLYWLENLIIGLLNVAKILMSNPGPEVAATIATKILRAGDAPAPGREQEHEAIAREVQKKLLEDPKLKVVLAPFFILHYGLFCAVHGFFIHALLGDGQSFFSAITGTGLWAVLALAASHVVYFLYEFVHQGGSRRTSAFHLMMAPYGRIVVLHIAIIFGAFAILRLGSPVFLLVLLVLGKTGLELGMLLISRRKTTFVNSDPV